jgi:phenylalanyl-tRNA synthetase alpha chain
MSEEIQKAASLEELAEVERRLLGRESALSQRKAKLKDLPPEERKTEGQAINEERTLVERAIAERRAELEATEASARLAGDRLDLTEVVGEIPRGHLNLVTQTRDRLEDVFCSMGFVVAEGPEVETDWNNFTALNLPPAHPARSAQDSLYVEWGEAESTLLRTHTSPVQVRLMQSQEPPIYAVMPGRVYRRDTPDARHLPSFTQIEGLVVDEGISFRHLAGTLQEFTTAYFGEGMQTRLRPSHFPFTEPSAEFDVSCVICEGAGCRTCSHTGWVELGGCGMVHPKVFEMCGVDPERFTGFAFGFGIDRLAQMRHRIADMRVLGDNDLRLITQF